MTETAVDRMLGEARRQTDRVEPGELDKEVRAGAVLVDIRPAVNRRREGSLPGAVVIERIHLEWRLDPTSPHRIPEAAADRRVIVVCNEGYASSLAAAVLRDLGIPRATDLAGGYRALDPARRSTARFFSFPNPVNEIAARLVAGGVVAMSATALLLDQRWITAVLAYGFLARVLTGPKLSPLGLLVTKIIVPRLGLEPRMVPGPPKRFAQGIGATFTVTAAILALVLDQWGAAQLLLAAVIAAASLEAFLGFCLGCKAFAILMRAGVVPDEVCERCKDIGSTPR